MVASQKTSVSQTIVEGKRVSRAKESPGYGKRAAGRDRVARLAAAMDDSGQWSEAEEVGPGFYRAPKVAAQLAEAVASYRAARGLTQQQLAHALALHQSQVARLESAQHTPSLETLVRVARHLGLSLTVAITPNDASLRVADQTGATD